MCLFPLLSGYLSRFCPCTLKTSVTIVYSPGKSLDKMSTSDSIEAKISERINKGKGSV